MQLFIHVITALTAVSFLSTVAAFPDVDSVADAQNDLLFERQAGTNHCSNSGKLNTNKFADQGCDPARSKGFGSAHNCKNKGFKAYFCYQNGISTCYKLSSLKLPLENGECFN
ncbi:hypothetical protein CPC08DRAFT_353267 [Agrocybe pediades]|nr:hypothetical protein CPC08DRAFT_353267 [Agrocybe pediades]